MKRSNMEVDCINDSDYSVGSYTTEKFLIKGCNDNNNYNTSYDEKISDIKNTPDKENTTSIYTRECEDESEEDTM